MINYFITINISYSCLSIDFNHVLGLMQMGGGNAESETLLNLLDMPHGSTFKKTTFSRIKLALRGEIKNLSDESMMESRNEEIKESIG